jgi:hypothetical protein
VIAGLILQLAVTRFCTYKRQDGLVSRRRLSDDFELAH